MDPRKVKITNPAKILVKQLTYKNEYLDHVIIICNVEIGTKWWIFVGKKEELSWYWDSLWLLFMYEYSVFLIKSLMGRMRRTRNKIVIKPYHRGHHAISKRIIRNHFYQAWWKWCCLCWYHFFNQLPETIIVKVVITGVSQMNTKSSTRREKNLFGSITPNLCEEKNALFIKAHEIFVTWLKHTKPVII